MGKKLPAVAATKRTEVVAAAEPKKMPAAVVATNATTTGGCYCSCCNWAWCDDCVNGCCFGTKCASPNCKANLNTTVTSSETKETEVVATTEPKKLPAVASTKKTEVVAAA